MKTRLLCRKPVSDPVLECGAVCSAAFFFFFAVTRKKRASHDSATACSAGHADAMIPNVTTKRKRRNSAALQNVLGFYRESKNGRVWSQPQACELESQGPGRG